MAKMDGYIIFKDGNGRKYDQEGNMCFQVYWNDLNYLMPLAWKHKINVIKFGVFWEASTDNTLETPPTYSRNKEDPIQAIRDCLYQIWSES